LGLLPGGSSSTARGVNDHGQVVGTTDCLPFFWSSASGMQALAVGSCISVAAGINNSGQVVGDAGNPPPSLSGLAFLSSGASDVLTLGTLQGGTYSAGRGINDQGVVVGFADRRDPPPAPGLPSTFLGNRAFIWSSTSGMQELSPLPFGSQSLAFGINNNGQVVGQLLCCSLGAFSSHAFLWSSATGMQDLGTLPGANSSVANAINNIGQVVGVSDRRAFLWSNGVMVDLSALPVVVAAGWTSLGNASAINNAGQIVGWGVHNGLTRAFLLTPVNHVIKLSRPDGSSINDTILDEIEPGKTTTLIARVYDQNNQLVPNVDVELKVDVVAMSGGHGHDDADRHNNYAGTLSPIGSANGTVSDSGKTLTGSTDTAGLFFRFNSPAFPSNPAGDHFFTAKCTGGKNCTLKGPTQVGVEIKDLGVIPENLSLWRLVGRTDTHPKNHYVTLEALDKLIALANGYHDRFPNPPLLGLNDASLERGGLFDLYPKFPAWKTPHKGHRKGVIVDIRANGQADAIPQENFKEFDKLLRELGMSALPEDLNRSNGHFHTRLLGVEQ